MRATLYLHYRVSNLQSPERKCRNVVPLGAQILAKLNVLRFLVRWCSQSYCYSNQLNIFMTAFCRGSVLHQRTKNSCFPPLKFLCHLSLLSLPSHLQYALPQKNHMTHPRSIPGPTDSCLSFCVGDWRAFCCSQRLGRRVASGLWQTHCRSRVHTSAKS